MTKAVISLLEGFLDMANLRWLVVVIFKCISYILTENLITSFEWMIWEEKYLNVWKFWIIMHNYELCMFT